MPISPPTDAFLASLVNSSSDAILSKNLDGIITSWNQGAEHIFGYTAAEAVGQPVTLLFPPEYLDEEPTILARIVRGERIEPYETVRRHKNGSYVDVSLTVSPIVDAHGTVIGASKVARDITTQRREQERLSVTLSSIGDGVVSTDEHHRVIFMNPVAEKLTAWKSSDAIGRPLSVVFRCLDETTRLPMIAPFDDVVRESMTEGTKIRTLLVARDGVERFIDGSGAPIRNRAGQLIGVVFAFRDVTDLRAAERDAWRLAAIIESSDDAIISKDLNGVIRSWNSGAARIFGYAEDEVIGKPITLLIPPDRIGEEAQILARLQRGERIDHFPALRRRKDGRLIHVSLSISPIRDASGRIVGASKIARDITAEQVAQERLETHAAELEKKVRERTAKLEGMVAELEAFSYSLSHDMRAPLRAIQSFSEIVLNDHGEKIPEGVEYLRKVISAAGRMDRLIQDVLSFARLSRAEIKVMPLDVDKLVHDIIHERPELHPPRAIVTVKSPLLPVLGHDASLTQCITNLLDNAVKFVMPGVSPMVEVFTRSAGDRVRICVRDNGIGISPENQRRLFAIFQRLHPAERFEGTGVGLAIVRKAAERMNGTVGIESAEGQGSTFWVELHRSTP
jgi:PAS domain S-box-containing protein